MNKLKTPRMTGTGGQAGAIAARLARIVGIKAGVTRQGRCRYTIR
jgi:hypothetical protein